ncbi:MAG: hypothetical protein K6E37_01535 [Bacteroidales bacterium]|nr:hypothetical protein [Bacteroidales bacterium]
MKRAAAIIIFALMCLGAASQDLPSCVKADSTSLRFPGSRERFDCFAVKLKQLRECPDSSVTIWHVGGSHVQAGWFTSRVRHNFDSLGHYPAGGRGYIFPYPLAKTNWDHSFRASREGEWEGSRSSNPNRKLPVRPDYGIMGIAAFTADTTAAFGLGTPYPFTRLRILGSGSTEDVVPYVAAGADTLKCLPDTLLRGFVVDFPRPVDTVRVELRLSGDSFFTVTGLLPESGDDGGLHYVSTGVNGARTTTWTERCPEFERELSLVKPDLVIWGLGINDSACPPKDFNPERFKRNYRRLLDLVLSQRPDCAFVFVTNNDSWRYARRRMVHNDNGPAVQQAMYELAEEYDAAVWDLFSLMGGFGSADQWLAEDLMKPDRLHFSREGYELLGDLLYEALIKECGE